MCHIRIFLLHFQNVFENRARALVYFLISLLNPLIYIAFWDGAATAGGTIGDTGWTSQDITSYYFLLIIATSTLMAYIDMYVGPELIQQGTIVRYLLKPMSFFWMMFHVENSYRILNAVFGVGSVFLLWFFFGQEITIADSAVPLLLALWVAVNGFFISFTFRMIEGITAFFTVDIRGLRELTEAITFLFAGYVMPLALFPGWLETISYFLPFAYMIYYPIVAFQGLLSVQEMLQVIVIQTGWIVGMGVVYVMMWRVGVRRFTAVGN